MDKAQALEVLGLDEQYDEASLGRSKKKLCHKNRADTEKVAQIEAAAELLLAALSAGAEAVAPVAVAPAADPMAALREELAGMKTGALNKRARELGVDADAMDDAADADDPTAALIELIIAASPVPEPAAEPEVDPLDALKEELGGLVSTPPIARAGGRALSLFAMPLVLDDSAGCAENRCSEQEGPGGRRGRGSNG